MAKPRRKTYAALPLSDAFYAWLEREGQRLSLGPSGGAALADAVSELSRAYTRERDQLATRAQGQTALAARLAFFLPRDLPKVFGALEELAAAGRLALPGTLRVLDVGAGLGATSLGVARWLALHAPQGTRLEVTALEPDAAALRVFRHLSGALPELGAEFAPLTLDARASTLEGTTLGADYDLILFGFVLNEIGSSAPPDARVKERAELLLRAAAHLKPGGAMVILEPALKETARELMAVRDALAARDAPPYVFSPCLRSGPCPMLESPRDWCHQERDYALPPKLAQIARLAGLRYEGLSYASLVLTDAPRAYAAPEGEALYRVVSERLETKGKLELFGCGEAGYVRLSRLDREASADNRAFGDAQRGHVLRVSAEQPRIGATTRVTREG